jgi:acetoacetyl-CoA synthetase
MLGDDDVMWRPDPDRLHTTHIAHLIEHLRGTGQPLLPATDPAAFATLHRWSIDEPAAFWSAVWHDAGIVADVRADGSMWDEVLVGGDQMAPPDPRLGPRWFTGARLNFAENLLRRDDDGAAIIAWNELGPSTQLSWRELRGAVARAATRLRELGVGPGDRVAGWLPNIPETIVAALATAAIGAVWTSCSPDFGVDGIVDRFGQTAPTVLFFAAAYRYGGRVHDCTARARELWPRLPSVRHTVMIPHAGDGAATPIDGVILWQDFLGSESVAPMVFARLPFDHPLFVLYSSGTTGLPKCLVHSAGGTLLQLVKEHRLHVDLHRDDRLFYFTTCGWMMWNWQLNALAVGATLVLYDGAALPAHEPALLWRLAAESEVNVFGTSAKYLALADKAGLDPQHDHALPRLRTVLSTGSPLAPEGFDWVRDHVGAHVQVASISGGTDIVSCFVLGNPISPVRRGEIQGPGLGMAVDVFDADGRSCAVDAPGELVCTRPFPSMPTAFWNDPDGSRYRAAYFDAYPGVWRHGDWITRTRHGGFVISGRSDATLNPGGVRIGTAEIYRQVEAVPDVIESLVIGQRQGDDERIVLFVRLRPPLTLTDALRDTIRRRVRAGASPHHVPKVIVQVDDLPRTRSGKLSELAVRDVIEGRTVQHAGALANPESLEQFRGRPELSC